MRYKIGDVVVKQSLVFGRQLVKVTDRVNNIRQNKPGFNGVAVNDEGNQVRVNDPYGNKVWGFDHEIIKVHKRVV